MVTSQETICIVQDCNRNIDIKRYKMCRKHYQQQPEVIEARRAVQRKRNSKPSTAVMYARLKYRARLKRLEVMLTVSEFEQLRSMPCH